MADLPLGEQSGSAVRGGPGEAGAGEASAEEATGPAAPASDGGERPGGRRVLVIEHEEPVAELERLYLGRAGFEVHVVTEPGEAAAAAGRLRPDAVVLDLAVPGIDADALYARVSAAARPAAVVAVVAADDQTAGAAQAAGPAGNRSTRGDNRRTAREANGSHRTAGVTGDAAMGEPASDPVAGTSAGSAAGTV